MDKVAPTFMAADQDKDGHLSSKEFFDAATDHVKMFKEKNLEAAFAALDKNNDKKIDR